MGRWISIGWLGLRQEALCDNGKIPLGSLDLWLISSALFLVGLGGGSKGRDSLWLRDGFGGRFRTIRGMVDHVWSEVALWGNGLMVQIL